MLDYIKQAQPVYELLLNPFAGAAGMNMVAIGFYTVIIMLAVCAILEKLD